jgi:hypothetical protein
MAREAAPEAAPVLLPAPGPPGATPVSPAVAALIRLQRSGGNRAVAGLMRQGAAGPTAAALPSAGQAGAATVEFFEDLWRDDPASVVRLVLEVGRLWPGFGIAPGAIADAIGAYQDITAIPTGDAFLAGVEGSLIAFRSVVNVVTNAIGQVEYVDQLIQDYLAGQTVAQTLSILGIPADTLTLSIMGFTLAVNETASTLKGELTAVLLTLDTFVAMGAAMASAAGPPEDAMAWGELAVGYVGNMVGDVLGLANEIAGFVTGGFSQSGVVGQAIASLKGIGQVVLTATGKSKDLVLGIWNVLGGKGIGALPNPFAPDEGLTPTAGALARAVPGVARQAGGPEGAAAQEPSKEWCEEQLAVLSAGADAYARGDATLGDLAAMVEEILETAARLTEDAAAGSDVLPEIRTGLADALADLEQREAAIAEIGPQADAVVASMSGHQATLADVIAAIEGLHLPELPLPPDAGTAGEAIQAAYDGFAGQFESAKELVLEPLREAQSQLEGMAAIATAAQEAASMLSGQLADMTEQLREAVEQSDSLPELLEALLDDSMGLSEAAEGTSFEDLLAQWTESGASLAEARAAVEARARA